MKQGRLIEAGKNRKEIADGYIRQKIIEKQFAERGAEICKSGSIIFYAEPRG